MMSDERYDLINFFFLVLCVLIFACSLIEILIMNARTRNIGRQKGIEEPKKGILLYIYVIIVLLSLVFVSSNLDILTQGVQVYK